MPESSPESSASKLDRFAMKNPTTNDNLQRISVSVLDLDIATLDQSLEELWLLGIRNLHIDVIDTSFTDNISFSLKTVLDILEHVEFSVAIHFMIENPMLILDKILKKRSNIEIIVHSHFEEVLSIDGIIHTLAISPDQSVDQLSEIVSRFQSVLVMTVEPGFGGQKMIEECTLKISQLKQLGKRVGVDGGVTEENIHLVSDADIIVIGSAITKSKHRSQALSRILTNYTL